MKRSGRSVAVLMGGLSSEREISLVSGRAVSAALTERGYRVHDVDVERDVAEVLARLRPEVAFLALHGRYGEDGAIQGLLELMGIPYTGSGVLASAAAFDKLMTKRLLVSHGVPTPAFEELTPETRAVAVPYPLVVKPNQGGSSLGVRMVKSPGQLPAAVAEAFAEDGRAYAEQAVTGREVTVSVIGGEPLPIVEVVPAAGMYSYEAKYQEAGTQYKVPAELPEDAARAISRAGVDTYRALGCAGAARVDVMLDDRLDPWVLEINTIPGLTPKSLLPKAAAAVGMSFGDLVERMLAEALP